MGVGEEQTSSRSNRSTDFNRRRGFQRRIRLPTLDLAHQRNGTPDFGGQLILGKTKAFAPGIDKQTKLIFHFESSLEMQCYFLRTIATLL